MPTSKRSLIVCAALLLLSCEGTGADIVVAPSDPHVQITAELPAAPTPAPELEQERTLVHGELLTPGTRYRSTAQVQDIEVVFTAPSQPLYAQASSRFVGMSTDPAGDDLVVVVLPIAGIRVFPSPELAASDIDRDRFGDVTEEAPRDLVAWLAEREYLLAGGIDERMRVGSLTGRGFAYEVGPLSGRAQACGPAPTPPCAVTFWTAGRTLHVGEGERGHVLELDVAGQPMLAIVRDHPAAAELVSTLRMESPPVPTVAAGASRLPYFTLALEPATSYYVDKIGRGIGLLMDSPPEPVAASQRKDVVWFGDPDQPSTLRRYFFTALDAANVVANPDPSLNPYALVRPGGIVTWELERFLGHTTRLPGDPVRWLTEQPYVVVEEGAHDDVIAGHRARVADVRAARLVDGLTCPDGAGSCVMTFAHGPDAFPIVISSEYVTRIVDLTVGDRRLLVAAELGSPGEAVLASLHAIVLNG